MATRKMDMQRKAIEAQRDRLLGEIEALKNKVAGLELALSLLGNDTRTEAAERPDRSRGGLKQILTDLLREAGTTGLNAAGAVEVAERRGMHIDKQSVSSTLSRMKGEGLVHYNGERYRLTQFVRLDTPPFPGEVVSLRSA